MRPGQVSVDVPWMLNWLWFGNQVYGSEEYRPAIPDTGGARWEYTRPAHTPPGGPLAQWRFWRDTLWSEITGQSQPGTELTGCDAPEFASLAQLPSLQARLAHGWEGFRRWWTVAEPELASAARKLDIGRALAETDRLMPDRHELTIFIVAVRATQTLAESHRHPEGAHHAVVSVGFVDESDRFTAWLHRTVAEIARHNS